MKKIVVMMLLSVFGGLGGIGLVMLLLLGNGAAGGPVALFATLVKAEEYQYVGSELGIPWEMAMLADGIKAFDEDRKNIEDSNPLITALEFCKLIEQQFILQQVFDSEGNPVVNEDGIYQMAWELEETVVFTACDEILSYIGANRNSFDYDEPSLFVSSLQKKADDKSYLGVKYQITMLENTEYEEVLKEYIGLNEKDIDAVLELYEVHYLAYCYGFLSDEIMGDAEDGFVDYPVIEGDVTREELARVAVSIMNWPYLLGGKSAKKGIPVGPLDCSGYIDWVYIQCFGKGVSAGGGRLPPGVAVSGTAIQYYASDPIEENELKIGDLGFLKKPSDVAAGAYNHIGIYIGEINGEQAWIHCGGSSFGYDARPKGRVGISVPRGSNDFNCVTNTTFSPPMKGCNFKYLRRPKFVFKGDEE